MTKLSGKVTSVRLDSDMYAELMLRAGRSGKSLSEVIRDLLAEAMGVEGGEVESPASSVGLVASQLLHAVAVLGERQKAFGEAILLNFAKDGDVGRKAVDRWVKEKVPVMPVPNQDMNGS
ncbi:MAG: CopG family transcriptional regulator [Planctomycetes bacterium]|nr:CopG family transcriptional regulator [Planctomycetota bacterium]